MTVKPWSWIQRYDIVKMVFFLNWFVDPTQFQSKSQQTCRQRQVDPKIYMEGQENKI